MTDIKANKATMSSTDFAFLQPRQKISLAPSNAPEPSMPSSNSTPRAQRSSTSSVEPHAESEHDHIFADNATTEYKLHPTRSIERLSCPSERTPDPRAPRYVPEFNFVPTSLDFSASNLMGPSSSESSLPQTPESSHNSDRALSASCAPQKAFDSATANARSTGDRLIRHQNHECSSLNTLEDPQNVQEPSLSKDSAISSAPEPPQGSPVALQALDFSEDGADDMYDDTDDESDEEVESDHRNICIDCGNKGFEAKLLRVYGFDLARAASLMPSLHAMSHGNRSFSINMWNNLNNFKGAAGADEQTGGGSHTNYTPVSPSDNGLQGQQMGKSSKDPREDEDQNEDNGRGRKRKRTNPFEENPEDKVQYACPFNKRYPEKYNCGKLKFKTCHGPGFAQYRLLKTHLETVHTNVQCERCSTVFEGTLENRIKAQEEHLRECLLNPPTIAEGISNVQWNKIKKIPHKIRARKDGILRTDAEKWKDTWEILFPSVPLPEHLWCDASYRSKPFSTSTTIANQEYLDSYGKVLSETLNSQVYQAFLQSGANITAELLEIFQATASKAFDNWFLGSSRGQHALADPDQYIANQADPLVDVPAENSLMTPFNIGETSTSKPPGNRPEKLRDISSPTSTPFPKGAFNTNAMGQNFESPRPRSNSIPASFSTPQPMQGILMEYDHQYPSMSSASHSNNGLTQKGGGNESGFGYPFYGDGHPESSLNCYSDIPVSPFSTPAGVVPVMAGPYEAPQQPHSNFNNFNNGTHHPNQFNGTSYPSNQQSLNIGDGNSPLHGVYGNGIAQHQQPFSHMGSMRHSAQSQNLTEPFNFPSQDPNNDNDISNGRRNQSNS